MRRDWPTARRVVQGLDVSIEGGPGSPAVIVSGMGMHSTAWRSNLVPALVGSAHQVCLYEHGANGLGRPPGPAGIAAFADDLAGLLTGLGWAKAAVVGYSFGGLVALELAIRRPELVDSLTLMAAHLAPSPLLERILDEYLVASESGRGAGGELWSITSLLYSYSPVTLAEPGFLAKLLESDRQSWDPGQVHASRTYAPSLEDVQRIEAPALAIGFAHDVLVPKRRVQQLAEAMPACAYREVDGAGHAGPFERPAAVSPIVVDFLDRHRMR